MKTAEALIKASAVLCAVALIASGATAFAPAPPEGTAPSVIVPADEPEEVPASAEPAGTTEPAEPIEDEEPEEPQPPPTEFEIRVTFAGDCMIASMRDETTASNFNGYANKYAPSYFLQNVEHIFKEDDFTVVNLENVLSDKSLSPIEKNGEGNHFWFKSRTSNTAILTGSGVEAVSLANNHTTDYGSQGQKDTIAAVEDAGLLYGTEKKTFYLEKNGYKIAVICHGLWWEGQEKDILKRVEEAKSKSDFQIVFYHGGAEGVHEPEAWRERASRRLVDGGVDLVVGNGPHVLQRIENYKDVDIIYSMANFCFGGNRKPENRTMLYQLVLTVSMDGKLLSRSRDIIPCYVYTDTVNNYCPGIIEDDAERQKVMDFLEGNADKPL